MDHLKVAPEAILAVSGNGDRERSFDGMALARQPLQLDELGPGSVGLRDSRSAGKLRRVQHRRKQISIGYTDSVCLPQGFCTKGDDTRGV